MKKRGFLILGLLMMGAILLLQRQEMLRQMKTFLGRLAHLIQNGAITVYQGIKPFVIVQSLEL